MGNKIKDIEIDGQTFKVLGHLPIRLDWELEALLLEMAADYEGDLTKIKASEVIDMNQFKGINIRKFHEIQELLLTKTTLQPKITVAILNDYEHDLQPHLKELAMLLFEHYLSLYARKTEEKKKSSSS